MNDTLAKTAVEEAQEQLIKAAIASADKALADTGGRNLIPADEVVDWLLDIRQGLDRYYITDVPREEPA